jgi:hypothetical protein
VLQSLAFSRGIEVRHFGRVAGAVWRITDVGTAARPGYGALPRTCSDIPGRRHRRLPNKAGDKMGA